MAWNVREKLARVRGAFTTLLGLSLNLDALNYKLFSFGDCCFFHLRDGSVVSTFPAQDSSYFGITPFSISSFRQPREKFQAERVEGELLVGDKLLLATDAIACHLFERLESGEEIDTSFFEGCDSETWTHFIEDLRSTHKMRVDDVTVLLFEITEELGGSLDEVGPLLTQEPIVDSLETEPVNSSDTSVAPSPNIDRVGKEALKEEVEKTSPVQSDQPDERLNPLAEGDSEVSYSELDDLSGRGLCEVSPLLPQEQIVDSIETEPVNSSDTSVAPATNIDQVEKETLKEDVEMTSAVQSDQPDERLNPLAEGDSEVSSSELDDLSGGDEPLENESDS